MDIPNIYSTIICHVQTLDGIGLPFHMLDVLDMAYDTDAWLS